MKLNPCFNLRHWGIWLFSLIANTIPLSAQYYFYAPNPAFIPGIVQKNDLIVSAGLAKGKFFSGYDARATYSPVKSAIITAEYFSAGSSDVKQNKAFGAFNQFGEIGVGKIRELPSGAISVLGGYGLGRIINNIDPGRRAQINFGRWFLQSGLVYHDNYFRGGVALRLVYLIFRDASIDYAVGNDYLRALREIESKSPLFMPETGLNGGVRLKPFWFDISVSSIYPKTSELYFSSFNINLSLSANLSEFAAKKDQKNNKKKK